MKRTVRVLIPILVRSDGTWEAPSTGARRWSSGELKRDDTEALASLMHEEYEALGYGWPHPTVQIEGYAARVHWIEAELPVPSAEAFTASAQEGSAPLCETCHAVLKRDSF